MRNLLAKKWRCLGGDADPGCIFEDPGVDETSAKNDGFAVLQLDGVVGSGNDGSAGVHLHGHGLGDYLLNMALPSFGEKFGFGEKAAVGVDVDQAIVEQRFERFEILEGFGLIPGVLERENMRFRVATYVLGTKR